MHQERTEGTTAFFTNSEEKISSDMPIFYNPIMQLNRDLTLVALSAYFNNRIKQQKQPTIALPMEASGIRAARILNELVSNDLLHPRKILINDVSPEAIAYAKENVERYNKICNKDNMDNNNENSVDNNIQDKRCIIQFSTQDASIFLRSQHPLDYIDLDPFGTPNPFLDAAIQKLSRGGMIAVTATDTSALAGTYPRASAKKYWAVPTRTWLMHEAGLRILIRKVQLVGAQYDKALVPMMSVSTDHYYRIFFCCAPSHADVAPILSQHQFLHVCSPCNRFFASKENRSICTECNKSMVVAGPMWSGKLHEKEFVVRACALLQHDHFAKRQFRKLQTTLRLLQEESVLDDRGVNAVGYYDLHRLASSYNIAAPRIERVLATLGENGEGNIASRTQHQGHYLKTTASKEQVVAAMREANKK